MYIKYLQNVNGRSFFRFDARIVCITNFQYVRCEINNEELMMNSRTEWPKEVLEFQGVDVPAFESYRDELRCENS